MWTETGLSRLLLVKIRIHNKMKFTLPISFAVLDDILDAFGDWLWLLNKLFPQWKNKGTGYLPHPWTPETIFHACKLPGELIHELRKHGRWKLVEVDTNDVYVSVEFF